MKNKLLQLIPFLFFANAVSAQTFDPTLAAALQNTIDSIKIVDNIQGISASVIYPGQGMWKGVTGNSHSGFPITPDMEFGIASNTKLFTAVVLLKLSENNTINLDDSLHEWLPNFTNVDSNITIRQLLNHTSGLADVNDVVGYSDSILTNPNRIYTPAEVMTWVGPPLFPAGTGWNYSNTDYILAGMIAESATGQSFGQLLHDNILTPLQLDSTFLDVADSVLNTIAHPWQNTIDENSVPRKALNSAAWAAGGMYSTSGEMAQWYQALMGGQLLNVNSYNEMTTFVGSGNYGFGLVEMPIAGRIIWEHGGTIWGGYNSQMFYDTTSHAVICVLINQNPAQAFLVARQLLLTILNNPVGISETAISPDISVFPNPATETVHVDLKNEEVLNVKIYNATGELVQEHFTSDFSIASLPAGIYLLVVQTENSVLREKLIKR